MEQGNLQGWTEKTKTDTGGICGSGRKRLKIQGRTLQCWEVWQLIKKQLSWFLGGVVWSLKSQSSQNSLTHTHSSFSSKSPVSILMSLYHIPSRSLTRNKIQATQVAILCRHFIWKEAGEKICLREVMSLPIHVRKHGLIKWTAVGIKNKWDYQV